VWRSSSGGLSLSQPQSHAASHDSNNDSNITPTFASVRRELPKAQRVILLDIKHNTLQNLASVASVGYSAPRRRQFMSRRYSNDAGSSMAKKAAKSTSQVPDWMPPRFEGKKVCFLGRFDSYWWNSLSAMERFVRYEGGKSTDKLDASVDYLVVKEPTGSTGHEKNVAKLNAKGASIAVLSPQLLRDMLIPTKEQALEMIAAGQEGHKRFSELLRHAALHDHERSPFTFTKLNLKGQDLSDIPFWWFDVEDGDFQKCTGKAPENSSNYFKLGTLTNCRLDGSTIVAQFKAMIDCTCRNADLSNGWLGEYRESDRCRSDFSKAKLVHFHYSHADASESNFTKADLTKACFEECKVHNANFQGAILKSIEGKGADFSGSDFSNADLSAAELIDAKFEGCDLSGAKFCGAMMSNASLKNAKLDGVDFTDANVATVNFEGADISKAKGLPKEPTRSIQAGPKLTELSDLAKNARDFDTTIELATGREPILLAVRLRYHGYYASWSKDLWATTLTDWELIVKTAAEAFVAAAECWPDATPLISSVTASGKGLGINQKKLILLVREAWCETFGVPVPDEAALASEQNNVEAEKQTKRTALFAMLDEPNGIDSWNKQHTVKWEELNPFKGFDLSGKTLDGVKFKSLKLEECSFENSSLVGADLTFSSYKGSNFRSATMSRLQTHCTHFEECDFTGADLSEASLRSGYFNGANLCEANLTNANLCEADLRGAIFTDAKLSQLDKSNCDAWRAAVFDETTMFPSGFKIPASLLWKGKEIDPRAAKALKLAKSKGPISLDQFIHLLQASVDKERLNKATTMLKAERFRLFAQAADDHLAGVVKSQNDPDLVYSCRLSKDGNFSCCTQNLKPCGGLRGALCKHLLVLIIGMTKGGEVDPTTVNQWIQASKYKKPELDKEVMGETLLKYKGAEAGEVDWRPMETIPEDYYSL